jgi:hypothetical protein
MADAASATLDSSRYTTYADYGPSGKLLCKITRAYDGLWAHCETADAVDGGASDIDGGDGDFGLDAMDADAATADTEDLSTTVDTGVTDSDTTSTDVDAATGAPQTQQSPFDPLAFMDSEIEKLSGPQDKTLEPDLPDLTPPEEIGEKASSRFQDLANRLKTTATENQQLQRQVQDQTQYVQQVQQWAQNQQQQMAQQYQQHAEQQQAQITALQDQLNKMMVAPRAGPNEDPLDNLKNQWFDEWNKQHEPKYSALEEKLNSIEQQRVQDAQRFQQQQNSHRYKTEARGAVNSVLLEGIPPEIQQKYQLDPDVLAGNVMTTLMYSGIPDLDVSSAAQIWRLQNLRYNRALMEANSGRIQADLKKSNGAPAVVKGPGHISGQGVKIPNREQLQQMGYHGDQALFDWSVDKGVTLPDEF